MGFLDKAEAIFQPQRTDNLRPGAAQWIGRSLTWQNVGVVDPGYDYEGQNQWAPLTDVAAPFAWVPEEDLIFTRP